MQSSKIQVWLVLQMILFHKIKDELKERSNCEYYDLAKIQGLLKEFVFALHIALFSTSKYFKTSNLVLIIPICFSFLKSDP